MPWSTTGNQQASSHTIWFLPQSSDDELKHVISSGRESARFFDANYLIGSYSGIFFLMTGVWSGPVGLTVERHEIEPDLDETRMWEDIAEADFAGLGEPLTPTSMDGPTPSDLIEAVPTTAGANYTVRCHGIDRRVMYDGAVAEVVERYLLQVWPIIGDPRPPRTLRDAGPMG